MRAASAHGKDATGRTVFGLSIGVCLVGGFLSSAIGLLVPRLTLILGLDFSRALLVQFAYHLSFLLFATPIALWIVRVGYMRSIASGLWIMVAGCIALTFAAQLRSFPLVLLALVMLSTGTTFLQIASNTVVTLSGPARYAASRLTMLQGFNSAGTVAGPLVGAVFLLSSTEPGTATSRLWSYAPFLASGICIAALALAFAQKRDILGVPRSGPTDVLARKIPDLIGDRRIRAGTAAMFAYVGAEVTIGTLLPNFLMLEETIHAQPVAAGQMTSLYWLGAMIGRFTGAFLLKRRDVGKVLAVAGIMAIALVVGGALMTGAIAASALIAVGLCNSIMYPTIYALTLPMEDAEAPFGSMLLCMAVVGGAIIPLSTGVLADRAGLGIALLLPAACYAIVALFGWTHGRATDHQI